MTESSLYERLGGAFAIAAVVEHFSEAVVQNSIVGQKSENPALRESHTNNLGRLPGLKFMRTLWVCNVAGGPQHYAATKPRLLRGGGRRNRRRWERHDRVRRG
jgi:hemoglobin